jgi:hypothetical protein
MASEQRREVGHKALGEVGRLRSAPARPTQSRSIHSKLRTPRRREAVDRARRQGLV